MATQVQTVLTDDIDGSTDGVQTVTFGLHGKTYQIDLSPDHVATLEESLAEFIAPARRSGGRVSKPVAARSIANPAGIVRKWAQDRGIEVPQRGRIRKDIMDRYWAEQAA